MFFLFAALQLLHSQTVDRKVDNMEENSADPYTARRLEMVERQIAARGIRDRRVLNAMRTVKRHVFIPENMRKYAYIDDPLPIGHDQTISQPYIVAYMTECLELKNNDRVLEIGTGSGYQAAVLAEIVEEVYTIEIVEALAHQAASVLKKEGYDHVHCRIGDGYRGWPEAGPFDAIIITAAPPIIPDPLIAQLKEGGRMIVPVGTWHQELVLLKKKRGKIEKRMMLPVRFVPMTGEIEKKREK